MELAKIKKAIMGGVGAGLAASGGGTQLVLERRVPHHEVNQRRLTTQAVGNHEVLVELGEPLPRPQGQCGTRDVDRDRIDVAPVHVPATSTSRSFAPAPDATAAAPTSAAIVTPIVLFICRTPSARLPSNASQPASDAVADTMGPWS